MCWYFTRSYRWFDLGFSSSFIMWANPYHKIGMQNRISYGPLANEVHIEVNKEPGYKQLDDLPYMQATSSFIVPPTVPLFEHCACPSSVPSCHCPGPNIENLSKENTACPTKPAAAAPCSADCKIGFVNRLSQFSYNTSIARRIYDAFLIQNNKPQVLSLGRSHNISRPIDCHTKREFRPSKICALRKIPACWTSYMNTFED